MNKKIIGLVAVVGIAALGVGGYSTYTQKQEQAKYNEEIQSAISQIETISVMEGEALPSNEDVLGGVEYINMDTVVADIQSVDVTTPGDYTVTYTFNDSKGTERTVDVPCVVSPELVNHVAGLSDIEVDYGEELPEIDCTYDEYINSVTRTEDVNIEEPGTYPVTYTILGANGEMEEVEYTCTVNDTRPSPTPTPTPAPTPVKEKETEAETEAETETETEAESEGAVGNIPQTEAETVQTGDNTSIAAFVAAIIICLGVIGGLLYMKKKNKHD